MSDITPKPVILLSSTPAGDTPSTVIRTVSTNGSIEAAIQPSDLAVAAQLFGFDAASAGWDQIVSSSSAADALPPTDTGKLSSNSFLYGYNDATWNRLRAYAANQDGLPGELGALSSIAQMFGWNGASFDRVRLAVIYKSVAVTALGLTAVWTPAAGKKFRLMGYTMSVAGTLAATGVEAIKLCDNVVGNVIAQHNATVTITTPTGDTQIGADLGQGFLSAAANNVLQVNLGTAMGTGSVCVNAWGTEE